MLAGEPATRLCYPWHSLSPTGFADGNAAKRLMSASYGAMDAQ
jgi:hypothetical protein